MIIYFNFFLYPLSSFNIELTPPGLTIPFPWVRCLCRSTYFVPELQTDTQGKRTGICGERMFIATASDNTKQTHTHTKETHPVPIYKLKLLIPPEIQAGLTIGRQGHYRSRRDDRNYFFLYHHQSVLSKGRSFTAKAGTKVAVLLWINRCGSFPLLSALYSLFSI